MASNTVRVACKLPAGLIVDHKTKDGREGKFTLKGAAAPGAVGGFGITEVDADLFESWASNEGKDFAPVKNGLIFTLSDKDKDGDAAKERGGKKGGVKSGAEPINPSEPGVGVEPTDEQKKELNKLPEDPGGQTVATA